MDYKQKERLFFYLYPNICQLCCSSRLWSWSGGKSQRGNETVRDVSFWSFM